MIRVKIGYSVGLGPGTLEYIRTFFENFGLSDLRCKGTFIELGFGLLDLCIYQTFGPSWGIMIINDIIDLFSQSSLTFALENYLSS